MGRMGTYYDPAAPSSTLTYRPAPIRTPVKQWSPGSIDRSPYDPAMVDPFSRTERAMQLGVELGQLGQAIPQIAKVGTRAFRAIAGPPKQAATTLDDVSRVIDNTFVDSDPLITPASPKGKSRLSDQYKMDRKSKRKYNSLLDLADKDKKFARNTHNKIVREVPEYGEWVARQNGSIGAIGYHGPRIEPRPQLLPYDFPFWDIPPKLVKGIPKSKVPEYIAAKYNTDPYFRWGLNNKRASEMGSVVDGSPIRIKVPTPAKQAFQSATNRYGKDVAKQMAAEWSAKRKAGKNVGPLEEWLNEGFMYDHGINPEIKATGRSQEQWEALDYDRGAIKSLVSRLNDQKGKWDLSKEDELLAERILRRSEIAHRVGPDDIDGLEQYLNGQAWRDVARPGRNGRTFIDYEYDPITQVDSPTSAAFDNWARTQKYDKNTSSSNIDEVRDVARRVIRGDIARHEAIHGMPIGENEAKALSSIFDNYDGMKHLTALGVEKMPKEGVEHISNYFTRRNGTELKARFMQLKDWVARRNGLPLDKDFQVTKEMFDDGVDTYLNSPYTNKNNMFEFFSTMNNKGSALDYMNRYALGVAPVIGYEANNRKGRFSK